MPLYVLDLLSIAVFAVSGALVADALGLALFSVAGAQIAADFRS